MDTSADERFAAVVAALAGRPGVTAPDPTSRAFGAAALKVDGSIFAMLQRGRLVVKLPRGRVQTLLADGTGVPFDSGKGRPMKEWVAVPEGDVAAWRALAEEALRFVGRR